MARRKDRRPLTAEQQALADEYVRGWDPVRALGKAHPRMLFQMVKMCGNDVEEVRSILVLGVIRAAGSYRGDKGCKFPTHALNWIRSSASHWLKGQTAKRRMLAGGARLISGDFEGRGPKDGEDGDPAWVVLGLASEEGRSALDDVLEGERTECLAAAVREALRRLDPRRRQVLELRFGIGTGEAPLNLDEVGLLMGISRERVRQLEDGATAKVGNELLLRCRDLVKFGRAKYSRKAEGRTS